MFKLSAERSESLFTLLLGLAFASLFFRHGVMHLVGLLFIIALLIARPRLPWIAPFWWMLGFITWEWVSNYIGPYHGAGIEGGGIGYHFLFLFIPLGLSVINYNKLCVYIAIGATSSSVLIWLQALIGIDLNSSPLRIHWEGGKMFGRAVGFNTRPWETQFIHSLVLLAILPRLVWSKFQSWFLVFVLSSGVLLPQIRAVIAAFISGLGTQIIFLQKAENNRVLIKRLSLLGVIALMSAGTIALLRPAFFDNLMTGNGRDKIFIASFEVFKKFPHTGVGGGEYFKDNYRQAWVDLGWHVEKKDKKNSTNRFLETQIGHTHNDALMLLAHHGWPALLLWTGFILHSLIFVWKHGSSRERTIFISLVTMHHVAGLSETYLDYSNTTYALFLCYGLALHGPIQRWKGQKSLISSL